MSAPVLVALNAFKGTLSALEASRAAAEGLERAGVSVLLHPVTDGGDGFVETVRHHLGGGTVELSARGPLGERVRCRVLLAGGRCFVETACACGMSVAKKTAPLDATTAGVGVLLAAAAELGAGIVCAGLGGSATADLGLGAAGALGTRFFDRCGRIVEEPSPRRFREIVSFSPSRDRFSPPDVELLALWDTDTALLDGLRLYSPQKGLGGRELERHLEEAKRLAAFFDSAVGRPVSALAGAGAAGGLGAGLAWFAGARLKGGFEWFAAASGLGEAMDSCRAVITGEGRFDRTSMLGKATGGVVRMALERGKPVAVLCGSADLPPPEGVSLFLTGGSASERAEEAASRLAARAERLAREGML